MLSTFSWSNHWIYLLSFGLSVGWAFVVVSLGVSLQTRKEPSPSSPESFTKTKTFSSSSYGHLEMICGPMFCGKSRELKRRLDVKRISSYIQKTSCVLVKFSQDTRYHSTAFSTHCNIIDDNVISASTLKQIADDEKIQNAQSIFIDEGQMFEDLVEYSLYWIRKGKNVSIAALDAYATQELWKPFQELFPFCTLISRYNAICDHCGSENATLTIRSDHAHSKTEIKIGGKELYKAMCLHCADELGYTSKKHQKEKEKKEEMTMTKKRLVCTEHHVDNKVDDPHLETKEKINFDLDPIVTLDLNKPNEVHVRYTKKEVQTQMGEPIVNWTPEINQVVHPTIVYPDEGRMIVH